ncbi:hypothetical protein PHMEG_0003601 [Phytophthora megakarya]|uniref:Uncharacterized protein n=1 Tax=Phytophthora megakarya TaxID=4795 RepID=A0A225WXL7_9STRA|nr:hypothetical protein PHMEG_0003601 [Phytophthora megakarya]
MPISKWFRGQQRSRTSSSGLDPTGIWSFTETTIKQKTRRSKTVTERPRRSQAQGSGFRAICAMVGIRASEDFVAESTPSETPVEFQRSTMHQINTRRRFTDCGSSYYRPSGVGWRDSRASSIYGAIPMGYYGLGEPHQTIPFAPVSIPSIIFIDCPP